MSSNFEARMWEKISQSVDRRRRERGDKEPDKSEVDRVLSNKIYNVLPNYAVTFNEAVDTVLKRTSLKDGHEIGRNIMRMCVEKPTRRIIPYEHRDTLYVRKSTLEGL